MLLSQLQSMLIKRTFEPMTTVEMDVTTVDTSNLDLEEPIYSAMLTIATTDSLPYPITDAELGGIVSPSDIGKLVDVAYLYLLRTVVNRMIAVDERLGPHGIWASQYPDRIRKIYDALLVTVNAKYGVELSQLDSGIVSFEIVL